MVETRNEVIAGHTACHHMGLLEIMCSNKAPYQICPVFPTSKAYSKTTGGITNKHLGGITNDSAGVTSKPPLL